MNEKELLHVAMINSYNLITDRLTMEYIEEFALPIFVHFPEKGIDKMSMKVMMMYFITTEDYEICQELSTIYESIFNESMPNIMCTCKKPNYSLDYDKIVCNNCKEIIV